MIALARARVVMSTILLVNQLHYKIGSRTDTFIRKARKEILGNPGPVFQMVITRITTVAA